MSELITAVDKLVHPDYHMFGIADQGSRGELIPSPKGDWLGVGRVGVMIGVAEQLVSPSLRVEVWDGRPPDLPADHEVQRTVPLFLPTGRLTVDEVTSGFADGLPTVRPGHYQARITGWHRERTRRDYGALGTDWDTPEFEAASAALEGQERYLVQLWLANPTATLLDSIGLKVHAGYPFVAFADDGSAYTTALPTPSDRWVAGNQEAVLVQVADQQARPVLYLELWDGTPPAVDGEADEFTLKVPTGAVTIMQLRSAIAEGNERTGGAVHRFFRPPAGTYHVRMSATPQRFLAQFWAVS